MGSGKGEGGKRNEEKEKRREERWKRDFSFHFFVLSKTHQKHHHRSCTYLSARHMGKRGFHHTYHFLLHWVGVILLILGGGEGNGGLKGEERGEGNRGKGGYGFGGGGDLRGQGYREKA